jgi:hypothetical protein
LRFREAFLRRADEVQAVLSLVRVMAQTPHGSWQGCPHFGFRDFFEQARMRPDAPQLAAQEANLALEDLGVLHLRVESIVKEAQGNRDVDSYIVTLANAAEAGKTYSLSI